MIKVQEDEEPPFNDLIDRKVKGLIFLLRGPLGLGNIFTGYRIRIMRVQSRGCETDHVAESLSEQMQRLLYTIRYGDLSGLAISVERTLNDAPSSTLGMELNCTS